MQAGGTCGNVLAALAYLDWTAYPVARLGDDGPMRRVCQDLTKWGVRLDFVLKEKGDGTPVIAQYIRGTADGGATHSFSWRCPTCGADLPRYKPLRIADVEGLLPDLPVADVFFFDRVSPAVIRLATHYRSRGAVVAFEPSGVGDVRLFREAVAASHLVKYSHERVKDPSALEDQEGPGLLVETSGEEGLRFRARLAGGRNRRWKAMPAIPAPKVRDTAGCGDWCTAGILHTLATDGARSFASADEELLTEAMRYGQALAAWNCGFEGARGGMYDVAKSEFQGSIVALLAGESTQEVETKAVHSDAPVPSRFTCSACPSTHSITSVEKR
jgi:fructokinase